VDYAFIAIDSSALALGLALGLDLGLDLAFFGFASSSNSTAASSLLAFIAIDSSALASAFTRARSFALYFKFRGLVLNRYPQHGHHKPSHLMKISQI
jgi:hypothetical protein